ncbi:MAG: DNA helicase UvrD [Actinobacteria bacterium]|jgi:DNA helicase IV|nr:DNA helicase UvrD [Actinomycetota bacterium]
MSNLAGHSVESRWHGPDWTLTFDGFTYLLTTPTGDRTLSPTQDAPLVVRWSWFRRFLHFGSERLVRLSGLNKSEIARLVLAVDLAEAVRWSQSISDVLNNAAALQRWIPRETTDDLIRRRPTNSKVERLERSDFASLLSEAESKALGRLRLDIEKHIAEANEFVRLAELITQRSFFDRIESQPLTEEQANAVIAFDNRVQVVAAAGSGKTSVMVARAAYAVHRSFVAPERILLLAFNKAAAEELQQRVQQRLASAGIDAENIRAATFHSFGLDVIGESTGARPRPAPWLDNGRDLDVIQEIVDRLRESSADFRYKWDLFRLLFANLASTPEGGDHDHYDRETRETGFRTFDGKYVRSHGERLVANWLYLNGVNYEYERPYVHRTASPDHSQYRPDFYYPAADLWHEHWALDRDGNPPAIFHGYAEGIVWKRETHRRYGTKLIETTWADVVHGSGLADLEAQLHQHGITTDWNPDRPIDERQVIRHEQICRLIRTFMTHIKSGKIETTACENRLLTSHRHLAGTRTSLFLNIYWPIQQEWDRRLREEEFVDFEDMLSIAADILENDEYETPYDLVLVDELQDASQARARLIHGLTKKPGKFLLAVGDDWQSINRFAGADISVMTDFHKMFGPGPRLELTTTFRCTQRICDVSSEFVSKNPKQLRKKVNSVHADRGEKIQIICDSNPSHALQQYLSRLSREIEADKIFTGRSSEATVDVLGRYRYDKELMPKERPKNLEVTFRTVHGAKGLEADYIVIANAKSGIYGFPSTIADDPVLDLAMSEGDIYEHAEERRLFYVALTRARRSVVVITPPGLESPFVIELDKSTDVERISGDGDKIFDLKICDVCGQGTLVARQGPYGQFLGCSRFPACRGPKKEKHSKSPRRAPARQQHYSRRRRRYR